MKNDKRDLSESDLYKDKFKTRESEISIASIVFLIVVMIVIIAATYCFRKNYAKVAVEGASMNQTLSDGDVLYAKRTKQVKRGDIVIIDVENYREEFHFSGEFIVKRLIATAGDKLYCREGVVYVCYAGESEFHAAEEPYVYISSDLPVSSGDFSVTTVEEGEVFVLGDNRLNSYDSGEVGCFSVDDIWGVIPDWSYAIKDFLTGVNRFFGQRK